MKHSRRVRRLYNPALVLFFLTPAIGELLSGSAPPLQFFNPASFLILTILYGGSALLIRELVHQWRRGWLSILVMGFAFGILNEGVIAKSFFDPHWKDLGPLASYGRVFGVNWVWTVQLMIYHAVISITVPILLTTILFPDKRKERWIGNSIFLIVLTALVLDTVFGFLFINPYKPSTGVFIFFVLIMFSMIALAKFLPANFNPIYPKIKAVKWFFLLGFVFNLLLFFATDALAQNGIPPLVNVIFIIVINGIFGWIFLKLSGNGFLLEERQKWGFVAGVLSLFILLSFVHEFLGGKLGMSIVGILFALFLLWMYRRLGR